MGRERTGFVFKDPAGRWYARFTYTDAEGQRRNVKKRVRSKAEGRDFLRERLREFEERGSRSIEAAAMTFSELGQFHREHYLIPAEYVDGRKIRGLRSYKDGLLHLKTLTTRFGRVRLRDITFARLEAYRSDRLKTPTVYKTPRSIASVNRELSLMRNMFNVAVREGWLSRNPFNSGRPLINAADEKKRQRVVTRAEEAQLLDVCIGARAHLRPLLVVALDTGCRQGELFRLEWADVDLEAGLLRIRAENTKTLSARRGTANRTRHR